MTRGPRVLVVGAGERAEGVVTALRERDVTAAAIEVGDVREAFAERAVDGVVCLGGEEWSPLAALAAVREHRRAVRAVVVGLETDVTGEDTRVVDDASPASVADAAARMVLGAGDGGTGTASADALAGAHHRRDQVRRILRATRELLAADDVTAICEVVTAATEDVLELSAASMHLLPGAAGGDEPSAERGDDLLAPVAVAGGAREPFEGEPPTYTPADRVVWTAFENGEPTVAEGGAAGHRDRRTASTLVLPLGDHGVLVAASREPDAFDEGTVDLAKLLAASAETALADAAHRTTLRGRLDELRDERDRLTALFANIPVPSATFDYRDGVPIVLDVNRAFEAEFGYDAAAVVGENIEAFVCPEDIEGVAPSVADEVGSGEALTREVRRMTADGLRDFLLTIAPVEMGVQDGLAYAFYIDITERRQHQQRLRVLSRVLRHDLRNQVTLVRGTAELVAERTDDETVERSVRDIAHSAGELAAIGRKTRAVERAMVGGDAGEVAPVSGLVEEVVAPYAGEDSNVRITAVVPPSVEVGSAEAVALALAELVENAVVHNDAESRRVWIYGRTTDDGFLRLDVADDGPGVPPEERAIVSGEREPTQIEHSSGLGLWFTRWLVSGFGGEFDIAERDGGGTVVGLWVPIASP